VTEIAPSVMPVNAMPVNAAATLVSPAHSRGLLLGLTVLFAIASMRCATSSRLEAAANARIGIATADLYPHFSLTGVAGIESLNLDSLFSAQSERDSTLALIALYKALGGGWQTASSEITAAETR
jgi:hypothetical protein